MENEMEIDDSKSQQEIAEQGGKKEKGKGLMVILVGAPGSGKSTFCDYVMRASSRSWARICQDSINNGKSGTKAQCLSSAAVALKDEKNVFIDRCNWLKEQRAEFVKLGSPQVDIHAVVLDLPAKLCISRSVNRTGHEGNLQGGRAAVVVNSMLQRKEVPKLTEGFSRITICQSESEVKDAIKTYSGLGPLDSLPSGCFGPKSPGGKVQVGIMKFLKKADPPANMGSGSSTETSFSSQSVKETQVHSKGPKDDSAALMKSVDDDASLVVVPTLAFPSISTADFQFDHEKASDIIVEKVEEYSNKLGNARLVLVDLSHKSKILSLVKAKAAQRSIDSKKFFTFVGDITCLKSKGGLHCNVIANAANWRLKPGGGGVNAAIFGAAGPSLEIATKERANSLAPGRAVVVPLPSISPLFKAEGVTHVIHVLGPNMNPQRPNCLRNDYNEGCKILSEAYSSLFEGFVSIVKAQTTESKENDGKIQLEKTKRESVCDEERSKKYKGLNYETGSGNADSGYTMEKQGNSKSASRIWGSFTLALYKIAMNPEKHKNDLLEIATGVVVLNDRYPKAKRHVLVLARLDGLDQLADVSREHLKLLKRMHEMGMKWVNKYLLEDESLIFRLGFHSVPSMRQLHLHVISQDFDSERMKHKRHWNSFNTEFFRDSVDVIEEVETYGKVSIKDESLLSKELRCHRCKSAHPNIGRLKSHIRNCLSPFPATLLQNNRLVQAPAKTDANNS